MGERAIRKFRLAGGSKPLIIDSADEFVFKVEIVVLI